MNSGSAESHPIIGLPAKGWGWKKFFAFVLLAFALHIALVNLFGAKKSAPPRPVKNVPVFHLADNSSELVRLTDPTFFALPHAEDFATADWSWAPHDQPAPFSKTMSPPYLAPNADALGAAFATFMQTNRFAMSPLDFKPEAQLVLPQVTIESVLPQNSTWRLAGEIAKRKILNALSVPTIAMNDVIAPSRVQVLVDTDGNVASAVLLESSEYDAADQLALTLARTLRFVPAAKLQFGEIIFTWHTVPTNAP